MKKLISLTLLISLLCACSAGEAPPSADLPESVITTPEAIVTTVVTTPETTKLPTATHSMPPNATAGQKEYYKKAYELFHAEGYATDMFAKMEDITMEKGKRLYEEYFGFEWMTLSSYLTPYDMDMVNFGNNVRNYCTQTYEDLLFVWYNNGGVMAYYVIDPAEPNIMYDIEKTYDYSIDSEHPIESVMVWCIYYREPPPSADLPETKITQTPFTTTAPIITTVTASAATVTPPTADPVLAPDTKPHPSPYRTKARELLEVRDELYTDVLSKIEYVGAEEAERLFGEYFNFDWIRFVGSHYEVHRRTIRPERDSQEPGEPRFRSRS